MSKIVEIYIELFEDGSAAYRPTQAIYLGNGKYQVLPTPNYDTDDEIWEFPPGTVIKCEEDLYQGKKYLRAVAKSECD